MACLGIIYAYDCLHFCLIDGEELRGGFVELKLSMAEDRPTFKVEKGWLVRPIASECLRKWDDNE